MTDINKLLLDISMYYEEFYTDSNKVDINHMIDFVFEYCKEGNTSADWVYGEYLLYNREMLERDYNLPAPTLTEDMHRFHISICKLITDAVEELNREENE